MLARRCSMLVTKGLYETTPFTGFEHEVPILISIYGRGNVRPNPVFLQGWDPRKKASVETNFPVVFPIVEMHEDEEWQRLAQVYGRHPEKPVLLVEDKYGDSGDSTLGRFNQDEYKALIKGGLQFIKMEESTDIEVIVPNGVVAPDIKPKPKNPFLNSNIDVAPASVKPEHLTKEGVMSQLDDLGVDYLPTETADALRAKLTLATNMPDMSGDDESTPPEEAENNLIPVHSMSREDIEIELKSYDLDFSIGTLEQMQEMLISVRGQMAVESEG